MKILNRKAKMNDLKQLISRERRLNISNDRIELISFDINMNALYVSDHNQIYQIKNERVLVEILFFILRIFFILRKRRQYMI